MTRDLAMRFAMVVHPPQVVAVRHRRERAVERQDFKSMSRKIQVANDLRSQQGDYVRAHRELEAGKNFFGTGRSAEHITAFEDENLLARASQIGGIDQTVVAAANHNHIVFRVVHIFIQPPSSCRTSSPLWISVALA